MEFELNWLFLVEDVLELESELPSLEIESKLPSLEME